MTWDLVEYALVLTFLTECIVHQRYYEYFHDPDCCTRFLRDSVQAPFFPSVFSNVKFYEDVISLSS